MEPHEQLTFIPVDHPDPRVQRAGFDLTSQYVEQCWAPVVGPSSTLLLRRLPALWIEQVPAEVPIGELSRALGLGGGTGPNSRLLHTIDRLERFGFAVRDTPGRTLEVRLQVSPLGERHLDRLPELARAAHVRLLDAHLRELAAPTPGHDITTTTSARLDRIQAVRTPTLEQHVADARAQIR